MTGFEVVAAVIVIFFGTGFAVGVLLVTSLSVLRRRRARRYPGFPGWPPPGPGAPDGKPPQWPGG